MLGFCFGGMEFFVFSEFFDLSNLIMDFFVGVVIGF